MKFRKMGNSFLDRRLFDDDGSIVHESPASGIFRVFFFFSFFVFSSFPFFFLVHLPLYPLIYPLIYYYFSHLYALEPISAICFSRFCHNKIKKVHEVR